MRGSWLTEEESHGREGPVRHLREPGHRRSGPALGLAK